MSIPAGWYDDGAGRQRWWDGQQWTEHFAPEPAPEAAPHDATAADASAAKGAPATLPPYATGAYSPPQASTQGYPDTDRTYAPTGAQAYGVATQNAATTPNKKPSGPLLGYIGLGLAVVGTVLACFPVTLAFAFLPLVAAFVVSIIGLFRSSPKWPAIVGLVLSVVGGIVGVVILVITLITTVGSLDSLPNGLPSSVTTAQPGAPSDLPVDPAGRPSASEITEGFLIIMHDLGITTYDDPEVSACIGQFFYDSTLTNETLTTVASGKDVTTGVEAIDLKMQTALALSECTQ